MNFQSSTYCTSTLASDKLAFDKLETERRKQEERKIYENRLAKLEAEKRAMAKATEAYRSSHNELEDEQGMTQRERDALAPKKLDTKLSMHSVTAKWKENSEGTPAGRREPNHEFCNCVFLGLMLFSIRDS